MVPQPRSIRIPHPPAARTLACWCLPTSPAALETVRPWLTGRDRQCAKRYRNSLRRRSFLIGSGLLRWVLGQHFSMPPHRIALERPPNRRPRHRTGGWLVTCALAVTHSRNWVLVGVLPRAALGWRLGIDAEDKGRSPMPSLNERLPWPDAVAAPYLLRRWTITEAALKADGRGLPALARLQLAGGTDQGWRLSTEAVSVASAPLSKVPFVPGVQLAIAVGRRRTDQRVDRDHVAAAGGNADRRQTA